jgi:hypothetical protein
MDVLAAAGQLQIRGDAVDCSAPLEVPQVPGHGRVGHPQRGADRERHQPLPAQLPNGFPVLGPVASPRLPPLLFRLRRKRPLKAQKSRRLERRPPTVRMSAWSSRDRSVAPVLPQSPSRAARAASTARSTSFSPASWTLASASPVAGSIRSRVSDPSTDSPPIQSPVSRWAVALTAWTIATGRRRTVRFGHGQGTVPRHGVSTVPAASSPTRTCSVRTRTKRARSPFTHPWTSARPAE